MNNLIKNVAIWLVIALVLMTVFNQFSTRQSAQKAVEYSQFIEEVKQGHIADGMVSAIGQVGAVLAEHFPRSSTDTNEIPDKLIEL